MSMSRVSGLERRLEKLELVARDTMRASVADFFRRVPSGSRSRPRWVPEMYPTGSESEALRRETVRLRQQLACQAAAQMA